MVTGRPLPMHPGQITCLNGHSRVDVFMYPASSAGQLCNALYQLCMCFDLHLIMNCVAAGGAAWTSAVIASLQTLTEAGATGSLPSHICTQLSQLAAIHSSRSCGTASTAVPASELAYGDRNAGSGRSDVTVPPPLQQQENTQLQLWWAVATAVACGQLGLPSQLGASLQSTLADDNTADVAFELQPPVGGTIMAHAAIIAAGCPKLYQAVQQQQQQQQQQQEEEEEEEQQQSSTVDRALHIQLGRSVMAGPFRQVLEYLYTGQVVTLTCDEERVALRKLAHALELLQLAALAAGRRPTPGAGYTFLKLAEIVPSQHLQIPWVRFMTATDSQKLTEQLQQQQRDKGMRHGDDSCTVTSGSCDGVEAMDSLCCMESKQHPSIVDLHGPETHIQLPDRLPVPASMPAHLDLLLVPRQCSRQCPSRGLLPTTIPGGESAYGHSWKSSKSVGMGQESVVTCPLQALPAHRAVLSATSPYFAAMLSDRWHAGSAAGMPASDNQMQGASRYLPAAHLPHDDMEVLSAFVQFCYTHELELQPCGACVMGCASASGCTALDCCRHCWSARTAVRLCVAAQAWMVPMLQDACLTFLITHLPALSSQCQDAVQADMTALHAWDLAHQLSTAFDRV